MSLNSNKYESLYLKSMKNVTLLSQWLLQGIF